MRFKCLLHHNLKDKVIYFLSHKLQTPKQQLFYDNEIKFTFYLLQVKLYK